MLRCLARDQPVRSYPVVRRSCPDNFRGSGVPPQRCGHVWLGSGSRLARCGCPHLANASSAPPCPCLLPGHGPPSARDGRPARGASRPAQSAFRAYHATVGGGLAAGLARSDHRARSDTWPLLPCSNASPAQPATAPLSELQERGRGHCRDACSSPGRSRRTRALTGPLAFEPERREVRLKPRTGHSAGRSHRDTSPTRSG